MELIMNLVEPIVAIYGEAAAYALGKQVEKPQRISAIYGGGMSEAQAYFTVEQWMTFAGQLTGTIYLHKAVHFAQLSFSSHIMCLLGRPETLVPCPQDLYGISSIILDSGQNTAQCARRILALANNGGVEININVQHEAYGRKYAGVEGLSQFQGAVASVGRECFADTCSFLQEERLGQWLRTWSEYDINEVYEGAIRSIQRTHYRELHEVPDNRAAAIIRFEDNGGYGPGHSNLTTLDL